MTTSPSQRSHVPRSLRGGGFTLVEMLVVVMLLGLIALLVIPTLGVTGRTRMLAAGRTAMADLQFAQTRALTTQRRHYIVRTGDTVKMLADNDAGTGQVAVVHPASGQPFVRSYNPANGSGDIGIARFDVAAGRDVLAFTPMGVPVACEPADLQDDVTLTGDVELELRSASASVVIRVEPATGEVSIDEPTMVGG